MCWDIIPTLGRANGTIRKSNVRTRTSPTKPKLGIVFKKGHNEYYNRERKSCTAEPETEVNSSLKDRKILMSVHWAQVRTTVSYMAKPSARNIVSYTKSIRIDTYFCHQNESSIFPSFSFYAVGVAANYPIDIAGYSNGN